MSNLGTFRDRKRKFSFLGGRTLAVVVITVVAAVSFSLGYNVGSSGVEGQKDQVQVVPEGAGLVLLGGNKACEDTSKGQAVTYAEEGTSPSVAVLETMKTPTVPKLDPVKASAGPEEPVLEPIGSQGKVPSPAKRPGERRVAPIRQLPARQPEPVTATASRQGDPEGEPALTGKEKTEAPLKKYVSEKPAVSRKTPVPQKRPAIAKKPAPVKKAATSKSPAVSSDGRAYSVQVGAFRSLSDARTHRVRFSKRGYKANVYKDKGADGSDIFKVRIGMFTARAEAEKMALRLKSAEGVSGFVTAIE